LEYGCRYAAITFQSGELLPVQAFADDGAPSVEERAQEHCRDNNERGRGSIVKNEAPKNHAKDDRGEPNDRSSSKI
jgi:hypothetical protein